MCSSSSELCGILLCLERHLVVLRVDVSLRDTRRFGLVALFRGLELRKRCFAPLKVSRTCLALL